MNSFHPGFLRSRTLFIFLVLSTLPHLVLADATSSPPIQNHPGITTPPYMGPGELQRKTSTTTPLVTAIGSDVQVTSDPSNLPQNEPSISINPKNSLNLVAGANDYRLALTQGIVWLGYYTSFDGGRTWANSLIPGFPGDSVQTILSSFRWGSDPGIAFDKNGNVYYSGIVFNVRGNNAVDGSVFVSKSTDGGRTFPQTVIAAFGSGTRLFHDKPYLTVDRSNSAFTGTVYLSWTMFDTTGARIMTSRSLDGGVTFSSPVRVSVSSLNHGSSPAVGPNGELYIAWMDFSSNFIQIAKSTNGGSTFTVRNVQSIVPLPGSLPNSRFRTNSFPTLAMDDVNGNVYIAWADYRSRNGDILFTRSTDGSSTWSSPIRANDDPTSNDQFFPWMAVSNGTISLAFYDRREDPNNHDIHVFYARSTNSGLTFQANTRVSDATINPDVNFDGQFIGDYIGITSDPNKAHVVWTGTRNGNQDIFTDMIPINTVHDIAVKSVSPERGFAYANVEARLNITVTVQNLGTITDTVTVTALANNLAIGSQTVDAVPPGVSVSLVFSWNTKNVAKGLHVMSANAANVQGETNTGNNHLIDGTVQVRLAGDVNADGIVNILDLVIVGSSFLSTPSSSNWNANADINNDKVVNILDIVIVGVNFGARDT